MKRIILGMLATLMLVVGIGAAPAHAYVAVIGVNDYASMTVGGISNTYTISSWHYRETTNGLKSPDEFRVTKTGGQCSIYKVTVADSRFDGYQQVTYGTPVGTTGVVSFSAGWGSPWYPSYHLYWTIWGCGYYATATTDIN